MSPHRKTCKRYNDPGHAHVLTFSCFSRRPFLSGDRACLWLGESIEAARLKHGFDLVCYVFMPEHVHLLIRPREPNYSISAILASIKTPVTRKAVAYAKQHAPQSLTDMLDRQPSGEAHHRFWQRGGGYDRNIITPDTAVKQMHYIHLNPVRRELCANPTDWKWSSASEYALGQPGPLKMDRIPLF